MKRPVIIGIVVVLAILGVWGWNLTRPAPALALATSVLEGPPSPSDLTLVSGITRSSDGNMIATVSDNKVIKLWDAKSAQLLHVLQGDQEWLFSPSFSPDGSVLATADSVSTRNKQYGYLQMWNPTTGQRLAAVGGIDWPKCVRFSPLGNFVVVEGTGDLYVVDTSNYALVQHIERPHGSRALVAMAIAPSGNLLATGGQDGSIKVWKMPLLEPVRTFDVGLAIVKAALPGEGSAPVPPASVAFSHDGKFLAANNAEGTAYIWDLASGNQVARYDYGPLKKGQAVSGALSNSLAFTSDDRWLITTDHTETGIRLLGVTQRKEVQTPLSTRTDVPVTAFDASAPNDTVAFAYRVYSTAGQPSTGKFEIWNLQLPQ